MRRAHRFVPKKTDFRTDFLCLCQNHPKSMVCLTCFNILGLKKIKNSCSFAEPVGPRWAQRSMLGLCRSAREGPPRTLNFESFTGAIWRETWVRTLISQHGQNHVENNYCINLAVFPRAQCSTDWIDGLGRASSWVWLRSCSQMFTEFLRLKSRRDEFHMQLIMGWTVQSNDGAKDWSSCPWRRQFSALRDFSCSKSKPTPIWRAKRFASAIFWTKTCCHSKITACNYTIVYDFWYVLVGAVKVFTSAEKLEHPMTNNNQQISSMNNGRFLKIKRIQHTYKYDILASKRLFKFNESNRCQQIRPSRSCHRQCAKSWNCRMLTTLDTDGLLLPREAVDFIDFWWRWLAAYGNAAKAGKPWTSSHTKKEKTEELQKVMAILNGNIGWADHDRYISKNNPFLWKRLQPWKYTYQCANVYAQAHIAFMIIHE